MAERHERPPASRPRATWLLWLVPVVLCLLAIAAFVNAGLILGSEECRPETFRRGGSCYTNTAASAAVLILSGALALAIAVALPFGVRRAKRRNERRPRPS